MHSRLMTVFEPYAILLRFSKGDRAVTISIDVNCVIGLKRSNCCNNKSSWLPLAVDNHETLQKDRMPLLRHGMRIQQRLKPCTVVDLCQSTFRHICWQYCCLFVCLLVGWLVGCCCRWLVVGCGGCGGCGGCRGCGGCDCCDCCDCCDWLWWLWWFWWLGWLLLWLLW